MKDGPKQILVDMKKLSRATAASILVFGLVTMLLFWSAPDGALNVPFLSMVPLLMLFLVGTAVHWGGGMKRDSAKLALGGLTVLILASWMQITAFERYEKNGKAQGPVFTGPGYRTDILERPNIMPNRQPR